uniref:Cystatin domain-containing protein n=1 Tax=Cucumis sativus TaxID=3659 RepID=A0A0A0KHN6_CUCSA
MCSHVTTGAYGPCEDPNSLHVKRIAEWAVEEYNKGDHFLSLVSILKCESQVVNGTNWRLKLKCVDQINNRLGIYVTVVWEKLDGSLVLSDFVPLLK